MGKNLIKQTSFRFSDESIIAKFDYIAKLNKRNRNQQVEWALDKFIKEFEAEYGKIPLEDAAFEN